METATKRIFIGAFTRTQSLQNGLLELQQEWGSHIRARWTKPENLHLTAYFYGNATLSEIAAIKEILHDYISVSFPVNAAVKGIDFFYKKQKPYILYFRLLDKHQTVFNIIQNIQKQLHRHKLIDRVTETYTPHITLARIKQMTCPPENIIEKYKDTTFDVLENITFEIIESTLTPQGPVYKKLSL